jgi:trypsin
MKRVLLFAVLGLLGCKASHSKVKIQDGVLETEGRFEYVVMMTSKLANGNAVICTGSFLNSSVVLTAAHCLVDKQQKPYKIKHLSIGSISSVELLYEPSAPGTYGNYSNQTSFSFAQIDVALMRFPDGTAGKLGITEFAKIPQDDSWFEVERPVTLVGYGNTDTKGGSGKKRWAINTITKMYRDVFFVENQDGEIEGPGMNKNPRVGDSGGPLLIENNTIVGVVSGGTLNRSLYPYTRGPTAMRMFQQAMAKGWEPFEF